MNHVSEPDDDRPINISRRMKDGKPMEFALLPQDATHEELRAFVDFLNGQTEIAENETTVP